MKRVMKTNSGEITLTEAYDLYIQEKEANGLSANTIRNYNLSWKVFSDYANLTYPSELTQDLIYAWFGHMRKEEIAPASQNHYARDIRAFINWLAKNDYCQKVEIKEVRAQEEQPKFYKDEDLALLLEKPRQSAVFVEWRTWAIVNTILATGARAQTICDMTVADIDFTKKEIALAHTKNKKAQNVPLSKSLETCLREYMRKTGVSGYLFPNVGNHQLTTNGLRLAYVRYCQDRGVEQTNIHGLRHSFARSWVKNGGSVFALQRILGHSSLTMTNRYVKLYAEDIKEDYEDFSALDVMKKKATRTSQFKKR